MMDKMFMDQFGIVVWAQHLQISFLEKFERSSSVLWEARQVLVELLLLRKINYYLSHTSCICSSSVIFVYWSTELRDTKSKIQYIGYAWGCCCVSVCICTHNRIIPSGKKIKTLIGLKSKKLTFGRFFLIFLIIID
jgi:hypothetical protein